MDLETVLQSDLNQKEKNKHYILMHMCGIQKNGTDKAICKAKMETQKLRTNVCTSKAEMGYGMNWETGIHTAIIKQIIDENLLYITGNSVFWGDLNEKERQTRGDVCIHISDSLCCTEEFKRF